MLTPVYSWVVLATTLLFCHAALADEQKQIPAENPVPDAASGEPARDADYAAIFTFGIENDIFNGSDRDYTNGVRASLLSAENNFPSWLDDVASSLPFFDASGHKRWGFEVGQSIFTPTNYELRDPPLTERPYAGWLYGSANLISDTGSRLDNLQLTLGVVGPASGAEQVQETVHDLIGSPHPNGWQHQLHNEPGIVVSYERKWRGLYEFSPFGFGVDATPSVGATVGNIYDHASVGGMLRFGYDLPSDYGPPLIHPSVSGSDFFIPEEDLGWYFFAGFEGRAVGRNIFLDGNTFQDSPSVDKEYFVGSVQGGLAVTYHNTRVAYTQVFRTKEYRTQPEADAYGAVTVSYRF